MKLVTLSVLVMGRQFCIQPDGHHNQWEVLGMKATCWCIALMVLLVKIGESQQGKKISVEQAKAIVRQFEGNPNLSLPEPKIYQVGDKALYHFRLPNGDEYRVNAFTGEVQSVFYGSRQARETTKDILANAQPLSKLEAIAWNQARRLYRDFGNRKMVLVNRYFDGEAYTFQFRERLPNGALTQNGCTVSVRADTGQLLFYAQTFVDVPPGAAEAPAISKEQALEGVRRSLGLAEITRVERVSLKFHQGRLVWFFMVEGPLPDGTTYLWLIYVDAKTGEVLEKDKALAPPFRQPLRGHTMVGGFLLKQEYGPLVRGKRLFVPSEIFEALGVAVKSQGNQAVLSSQRRKLVVATADYVENKGRLFLSPALLLKLLPDFIVEVHEDLGRKSVNILCANKESLGALIRYGKKIPSNLDEQRFRKVYVKMCQMQLILK
jgi:uncharacterized membrane protein YkoI